MKSAPLSNSAAHVETCFAELVAIEGPSHRVRLPSGATVEARRAIGCLAEPAVGDRVLAAGDGARDEWYVLSVLDREQAAGVTVSAERDLTVASRRGAVRIVAAQEIIALAGKALRAVAPAVELEAGVAEVAVRVLDYAGERIKTAAKFIETRAERVSEHVERSIRFVSELDMLRAKQVDHHAEDTMHLRARHALMTANQVVKIDGEQVQLG